MSAIASLTLNDGASTPVTHTFAPVKIDPAGIAKWADRSGGIALGYPVITMSLREPSKTSRNYKLMAKVVVPTLEVTSPSTSTGIQPAPTKAYDCLATVEMVFPERTTLAERKNLSAFVKNLLSNAVTTAAVENFEAVYG